MKHLLVTNDFPPKIGGIQSLLWEWWRRLPPESFTVLTSPYAGSEAFDAAQPFRVERTREPVLLPHPWMVRRIESLAAEVDWTDVEVRRRGVAESLAELYRLREGDDEERSRATWKEVKASLFPERRRATDGSVVELTRLEQLYRTFERC